MRIKIIFSLIFVSVCLAKSAYSEDGTHMIPIKDLVPLQEGVTEGKVNQLRKMMQDCKQINPIVAVKNGGTPYIVDGTHRTTAAMLEGKESIEAYLFEDYPITNKPAKELIMYGPDGKKTKIWPPPERPSRPSRPHRPSDTFELPTGPRKPGGGKGGSMMDKGAGAIAGTCAAAGPLADVLLDAAENSDPDNKPYYDDLRETIDIVTTGGTSPIIDGAWELGQQGSDEPRPITGSDVLWSVGAICLPSGALISTPDGNIPVNKLKQGDIVYSMNSKGEKIKVPVSKAASADVPATHVMVHITLKDGRKTSASRGHPVSDGRAIELLKVNDLYDGSVVSKVEHLNYKELKTFDILPESDTGTYWANGVLLGSTLK